MSGFISALIHKTFSLNSLEGFRRTVPIAHAEIDAVRVAEIKFHEITVKVGLGNVVVCSDDPALEDRKEILSGAQCHSLHRDIDGAKPAVGAVDVEGHGAAFVKLACRHRQVGAVHEHVARAVIAGEEAVALAVVETLTLPVMKGTRTGSRAEGSPQRFFEHDFFR